MKNSSGQHALFTGNSSGEKGSRCSHGSSGNCWLGLNTNQRRLFAALQDGWLRPLPRNAGMVLGAGTYVPEQVDGGKQAISVRMKFDLRKLPRLDAFALRDNRWVRWSPNEVGPTDFSALYWRGTLPMFAVFALEVATEEERVRLTGMARQFSNVEIPIPVTVATASPADLTLSTPEPEAEMELAIPSRSDAIRGSMSLATWAVPRIDPWLDVLVASLSFNQERLANSATKVDANWWRFAPWATASTDSPADDLQEGLWRAAVDVFRKRSDTATSRPVELAEKIAAVAGYRYGRSDAGIADWRRHTTAILRMESTIQLDRWRDCPVGMAIQLVLARPEPIRFKTWSRDMPNLPPAVWWSAAALCGLKHGYQKLDVGFRGQGPLQEALSVHALRLSQTDLRQLHWPGLSGEPNWKRQNNGFVLYWGAKKIAEKPNGSRGQWYAADFQNEDVRSQAESVAKHMKWACLHQDLKLPPCRLSVSGPGTVSVKGRDLEISGDVELRLPSGYIVEETLDVEAFRHHVVVAAGRLANPPVAPVADTVAGKVNIPGLAYVPDFLSEAEEERIVATIDQNDWIDDLKRRVQHYGWRYDYKARRVDPTMRLGPMPEWAQTIAQRLVQQGLVFQLPDQLIVNEYRGDQGISRHVDAKSSFADGIAMISLLESWEMVFRNQRGRGRRKETLRLERRSATIMAKEARYQWSHEIPKRKTEPAVSSPGNEKKRRRVKRGRRLSLTFRKVIERR